MAKTKITYRQLRDQLNALPEARLEDDVTVEDGAGEFIAVSAFTQNKASDEHGDALDEGHWYLVAPFFC